MPGVLTYNRYQRILNLPISFSQTDVSRGKSIVITTIPLALGQRLEVRALNLALISILTANSTPEYLTSSMKLCSVGLYQTPTVTAPLVYAACTQQTTFCSNPFTPCIIETAGTYSVIVSNNTKNIDLAVAVTGAMKLYA